MGDLPIIVSLVAGLLSIPFLVTGPLDDSIPTGKLVLNMEEDADVEGVPNKMTKVFSSKKFEKTYETAFGKFTMSIKPGEIKQELSKPGKVTVVNENTEKTVWKITTNRYQLEVVKTLDSVEQTCITPDGELNKLKERGEITETFQGMNQDHVIDLCLEAEQDLQGEVNKMEQIKEESEIPSTETKNNETPDSPSTGDDVLINEFLPAPQSDYDDEWVELYNPMDNVINLGNWVIDDEEGTSVYQFIIPEGTTIPAGGFLVFEFSSSVFNNGGDEVRLMDDFGEVVDSYEYTTNPGYDNSIGRDPDGGDTWTVFDIPTPTDPNSS